MNSHFQSSATTSTSSGLVFELNGFAGSSSCELIQAMLPKKSTTSAGMDQTLFRSRPDSAQCGAYVARALPARYHQANPRMQRIVGTTIASMMASELNRITRSAFPTGPAGSRIPLQPHNAAIIENSVLYSPAVLLNRYVCLFMRTIPTCGYSGRQRTMVWATP